MVEAVVKWVGENDQEQEKIYPHLPTHQPHNGGTVRGSAPRNPVRQEATAVKPWSFTFVFNFGTSTSNT